jgi:hypothetical protein
MIGGKKKFPDNANTKSSVYCAVSLTHWAKGKTMLLKKINSFVLASAMATAVFTAGCAVHTYYDPYYHDYHPVAGEVTFYSQWETETHRDHKDFKQRNKDEQKEYWDWRHKHDDHH